MIVEKECILPIRARDGELVDVCVEVGELKGEDERREGGGRREREEGEVSWTRTRLTILQNILEYFEQRHMTFEGLISVSEKEEVIRFTRY